MRVGIGYDLHRLVPNRKLILGGVEIPHALGLLGHSDADVLTHAVIDAILGAAALGDIGSHFPDTDPEYEGINSLILLEKVKAKIENLGHVVQNVDSTIIAQRPKMAPHIPEMRQRLAETLRLLPNEVNVKATTSEGIGIVGMRRQSQLKRLSVWLSVWNKGLVTGIKHHHQEAIDGIKHL